MNLIVEKNDIHLLHIRDMDDVTPGYIISGTRLGYQSGLSLKMARLIAASPDLLKALRQVLRYSWQARVQEIARAAINKAEGKEEHHEPS